MFRLRSNRCLCMTRRGVVARYPVSTASKGGEVRGSYCTPRGNHIVRAKIGAGCPENMVFVVRRASGLVYTPELGSRSPKRDWILARILWLSGCEPGRNRLGCVDTMRRYIYIHGCSDVTEMEVPRSHGCIRMRNADIVQLFDRVPLYSSVEICE